jgi:hypothetical protein
LAADARPLHTKTIVASDVAASRSFFTPATRGWFATPSGRAWADAQTERVRREEREFEAVAGFHPNAVIDNPDAFIREFGDGFLDLKLTDVIDKGRRGLRGRAAIERALVARRRVLACHSRRQARVSRRRVGGRRLRRAGGRARSRSPAGRSSEADPPHRLGGGRR